MEKFIQNDGKSFLLKDKLYNFETINEIGTDIKKVYEKFELDKFIDFVFLNFEELKLKQRITRITTGLREYLPKDYFEAVDILIESLPEYRLEDKYIYACFSEFVSTYGLDEKNLDKSFYALSIFTQYFSSEFGIREFINKYPKESFDFLEKMSRSNEFKQQRLASEGLRPKLPWAKKIEFDYKTGASLLDNLYYNENRFVTRSVANHLHDISKFDLEFVLDKLKSWIKEGKQNENEMNYIIRHSLRTPIKKGDLKTLKFLGFNLNPDLDILNFNLNNSKINIGDTLNFSFEIKSKENDKLLIDYIIYSPKKNYKVFKLKEFTIQKNQEINISKKHKFVAMSTRKLYYGEHELHIQINGNTYIKKKFILN